MPADECFLFVREQDLVQVNSRDLPQVELLVHGRLSHKQDDGLLVQHRAAHPRDPPEVLLQPLNPVGRVYHRLDAVVVVQVSEVHLVGSVLTAPPDALVTPAPFGAELLPLIPRLFHRIVPVSGAEHLP